MTKWIARLLGDAELDLPDGVPPSWIECVEQWLATLEKTAGTPAPAGLARDILGYLLHGEPKNVPSEAALRSEVGAALALTGYRAGQGAELLQGFYEQFNTLPLAVAQRWLRLIDAAAFQHKGQCLLQLAHGTYWPELLMLHAAGSTLNSWGAPVRARFVSAERMEALLVAAGLPPHALLAAAFGTPIRAGYTTGHRLLLVTGLVGYPAWLARHLGPLRDLMLPAEVPQRLHVLDMLAPCGPAELDALATELCEMGTSGSKPVRTAAEALLRRCGDAVFGPLQHLATRARPEQRAHALRLLELLGRGSDRSTWVQFARATAAADKAASVQALLAEWDAAAPAPVPVHDDPLSHPLPVIDWSGAANAPAAGVLEALWQAVERSIEETEARRLQWEAELAARRAQTGQTVPAAVTAMVAAHQRPEVMPAHREALAAYLRSDATLPPPRPGVERYARQHLGPAVQGLAATGQLTPVAVLRMLQFGHLVSDDRGLNGTACHAFDMLHRKTGRPTLLELSLMLQAVGTPGTLLLRAYCSPWGVGFAGDWPDADVWPYFAHHIDQLVQLLAQGPVHDYSFSRAGLFRALATLPAPHPAAVQALFGLALGSAKTDRGPAQEALRHLPGKEQRIAEALADGKAEVRAIAAQWLGRLRHAPSLPALERAVAREKNDIAKGALLDALQALGQPVEKYLDRQVLAAEAAKALAKGLPRELEAWPWAALPAVRWADGGDPVPTEMLRWLLVQAVKQKSPEPNVVLRQVCSMVDAGDREALGQFVLETWLREDTRPITPEEALSRARDQAQATHGFMQRHPQWYQDDPNLGKSVEELTALALPGLLQQPAGSAIAAKGLLAVAAACCAERAAAPVQRYLKTWYGTRAAQGKALIAMLAWIEHPGATQLMLAVGSRFRTKSFQEEATRQAQAMAERKGWTLAELADRTVPSAGFDETGTLSLSYGHRVFTARLLPDFKVELCNPEGKPIAALPEPRQDDDAALAAESKKALAAAKKELKSIVALQTDRLYEALCTSRDWPYADWAAYLQQHPVLRHLVQRLVWVQTDAEGAVLQAFRPLDDGTLTDVEDNAVTLPAEARVRLAHDTLLDTAQVAAWQGHLADYGIQPLFQQLGKGVYRLPSGTAQHDEVDDFEGHMLEAYALRGRALKLGYTRGATEDAGWFYGYEKRFPTLGLQACIGFTGNGLPEENRTVALRRLSFCATGGEDRWQRAKLPLSRVPPVLLSECWNDLRLIAAEGSGHDPDWQKKSEG